MSEDRRGLAVEYRRLIDNLKSRNQIEVAIGVLMTCADARRATRLANSRPAGHETGLSPGELASALVDMVSGNHASPHQAQAQHGLRHLLALRGLSSEPNAAKVEHSVRARYGPENESTICKAPYGLYRVKPIDRLRELCCHPVRTGFSQSTHGYAPHATRKPSSAGPHSRTNYSPWFDNHSGSICNQTSLKPPRRRNVRS
jgi:hypothetical protein